MSKCSRTKEVRSAPFHATATCLKAQLIIRLLVFVVAYVKFPSASQAAKALEHLHLQTIKDGKVTVQLKVMFADPVDKIHHSENRWVLHFRVISCWDAASGSAEVIDCG